MDKLITAKSGQYLTFTLKGRPYGFPIEAVREINRVSDITPVPQTPPFVAGVMNLRGKVIPIVNLRMKFGLEKIEHTKETCVIVIEGESGQIGTIVDSVSGVIELDEERIENAPLMGEKKRLEYVMGMGKTDDAVILLINIVKVLSTEEFNQIIEIQKAGQASA